MNKRTANLLFVGTCFILAILLLMDRITPLVSGCIFALALAILGIASRGVKKEK
jgi:hypothetical protein